MRGLGWVALSCLLLVGAVARGLPAEVLHTFESPSPEFQGWFGFSVSGVGDVDSDMYGDVIVGADFEDGGEINAGRAYVFSGQTGALLHTLQSPSPEYRGCFGYPVTAAGDVNNDTYVDVLVGAAYEDGGGTDAGRAYVFSGETVGLLYPIESPNPESGGRFGYSVSGAGDVNNDEYDDVIVGAYREDGGATNAGRAYVFSGETGSATYTLASPNPETNGWFGYSVSGAGDVDDDGCDDVIVGAYREDTGASLWSSGRAYVFSGATGETLYTLVSQYEEGGGYFGYSVSGAGDVNGDTYDDVIVGAWGEDVVPWASGRAYVFSGPTGALIHTLESPNPESEGWFGRSVSGIGDMDNDSCDDLIVGACGESGGAPYAGRAYIFSGQTGALLCTLVSPNPEGWGHFGRISGPADVNGDTHGDVIVGADFEDAGATEAGRAYVFSWMALSGILSGGDLVLQWSPWPVATDYWLYGADNQAYFEPGLSLPYQYRLHVLPAGTTTYVSSNGVGDPDHNWTYTVVAVSASGQELARSNRFGEHDFSLVGGP